MNKPTFKEICLMHIQQLTNFPYIEKDFDALTDYGLLCKVVEKLNEVITNTNQQDEYIVSLYNAFIEIKNYVESYFDNLDVQDEINNKLDEMVEDGTFESIIDDYLSYIKETYIIQDIEYIKGKVDGTDYYIAHVPYTDSENNRIVLKHGFAKNVNTAQATANENAREFALRNYGSFCVNASIFGIDSSEENYNHAIGTIIKDGNLISTYNNNGYTEATKNRMRILGVKNDGTLKTYTFNSSYDSLIEDGVINSFCGYGTFIENGVFSFSGSDEENIWNFICQNSQTKDLYFVCCNGRDIDGQAGIKPSVLADIMINNYDCDYGFALDAGGSTCFCKNGVMLNFPYDDYGQTIRNTPDYIYFSKDPTNNIDYNTNMELNFISEAIAKLNETYNRLYYLYNIHNNRLNFMFPNLRTSSESGIRFRYTKNDELKSQMLFDTDENELALSLFDNINNRTVARIDGLNEKILLNGKTLGTFFDTSYNITNPNDAKTSGIYRMPGNITNTPFGTNIGGILIVLKGASGGVRQIAIPQVSDSTTEPWYTRQSNSDATSWETWKTMFTPTA